MENSKKTKSGIDWTQVLIYFFALVLLPAIIVWGIIQYQKNQHSYELAMADKVASQIAIDSEAKEKERKSTFWGKVIEGIGRIGASIINFF